MHVTGVAGYTRGTSRRGTGHAGQRSRPSAPGSRSGRHHATSWHHATNWASWHHATSWASWHHATSWAGWHHATNWHRAGSRSGWRRVARELVLVAVFGAVYEYIGKHMVQAGGAAA